MKCFLCARHDDEFLKYIVMSIHTAPCWGGIVIILTFQIKEIKAQRG